MPTTNHLPILSAIIPIGDLERDYFNIDEWITKVDFSKIQVILVIDKPTKINLDLGNKFRKMYKSQNLIVANGNSSGPGSARNIGLALAAAEWTIFWDSDDLPEFQNIISALENVDVKNYEAIVGEYKVINLSSVESPAPKPSIDNLTQLELIALNPGIWRVCFRTKAIEKLRFPCIYMGEDQVFIGEFFSKKRKVFFSSAIFYNYRKGRLSQLTNSSRYKKDLVFAIQRIVPLLKNSENKTFSKIQFLKMVSTGLMRGNWKTRLIICRTLGRVIIVSRSLTISETFRLSIIVWGKRYGT